MISGWGGNAFFPHLGILGCKALIISGLGMGVIFPMEVPIVPMGRGRVVILTEFQGG